MSRRTTPRKIHDEKRFPIRVRVRVPEGGFGIDSIRIREWLADHVGAENFAVHGDNLPGVDAISIYLTDSMWIEPMKLEFGLMLAEPPTWFDAR